MVDDNFSCIKEVTKVVHITLPTACTSNEISGISDVLDSWKRQYIQQLQAVVVSYKNVSLASSRGFIKLDYPFILFDVKATFELFYPTVGSIVKGKINRISHDYIGCLVHNTINVTINRTNYTSTISNFVALDRFILFEITRLDYKRKIIHVKGKVTEKCVELMKESGMINNNIYANDNELISSTNANDNGFISSSDASSDDHLLDNEISMSNIKKEPLDVTKVSKKRKHESSDMVSLPKKKRKVKDDNSAIVSKKRKHESSDMDTDSLPKKKRKIKDESSSIEDKAHKKKKKKSIKNPKKHKEKKSKPKVVSTKKKLHGYENKLKKKKKEKPGKTKNEEKSEKTKRKEKSEKTKEKKKAEKIKKKKSVKQKTKDVPLFVSVKSEIN